MLAKKPSVMKRKGGIYRYPDGCGRRIYQQLKKLRNKDVYVALELMVKLDATSKAAGQAAKARCQMALQLEGIRL